MRLPERGRMRLVFVQHVPYVKTMLGGVILLKLACSQAVQNKQRCVELAECVPGVCSSGTQVVVCGTALRLPL